MQLKLVGRYQKIHLWWIKNKLNFKKIITLFTETSRRRKCFSVKNKLRKITQVVDDKHFSAIHNVFPQNRFKNTYTAKRVVPGNESVWTFFVFNVGKKFGNATRVENAGLFGWHFVICCLPNAYNRGGGGKTVALRPNDGGTRRREAHTHRRRCIRVGRFFIFEWLHSDLLRLLIASCCFVADGVVLVCVISALYHIPASAVDVALTVWHAIASANRRSNTTSYWYGSRRWSHRWIFTSLKRLFRLSSTNYSSPLRLCYDSCWFSFSLLSIGFKTPR